MTGLPLPLLALAALSLLASAASCVLSISLAQNLSPILWAVPGAFGLTLLFHILMFLLHRLAASGLNGLAPPRWTRSFSVFAMSGASTLAAIWIGCFVLTLYLTILMFRGQFDDGVEASIQKKTRTLLIETCVLSFVEAGFMSATVFWARKEWKKAQYPSKWQWTAHVSSGSKWSINTGTNSMGRTATRQSVAAI